MSGEGPFFSMNGKVCVWFHFRDDGLEPRGRLTLRQKTRDIYRTRRQYVSAFCVMHLNIIAWLATKVVVGLGCFSFSWMMSWLNINKGYLNSYTPQLTHALQSACLVKSMWLLPQLIPGVACVFHETRPKIFSWVPFQQLYSKNWCLVLLAVH